MIFWLWRTVVGRVGGRGAAADGRYSKATWDRTCIFFYDVIVCILLAVLAWAYFAPTVMLQNLLPDHLKGTPIYAVWFGALGGIVISLKGVYDHGPRDWQYKYNLWHYGRPFSGGIAGGIILLLLRAVGGDALSWPVALAAAFVIGTQERRFFNFLSEVARLIVQVPGDPQDDHLSVTEVLPQQGPRGTQLRILGTGFDTAATVWVGSSKLENVVVSRDGTSITGTMPAGSGSTRIWVENPSGAARVISTLFNYQEDVAPASLDFRARPVGETGELKVRRLNRLTQAFTITDVTVTGTNATDFDAPDREWVNKPIAPGSDLEIKVTFRPRAVGPSSATLVITSGSDTREVPLSGTGTPPTTTPPPTTAPPSTTTSPPPPTTSPPPTASRPPTTPSPTPTPPTARPAPTTPQLSVPASSGRPTTGGSPPPTSPGGSATPSGPTPSGTPGGSGGADPLQPPANPSDPNPSSTTPTTPPA